MTAELAADLATVRQQRIYFYHHSVGENILAGIERLDSAMDGGRLRIAPAIEAAELKGPVLAHGEGGENRVPKSKIDFFAATLRGDRLRPDIALMKFCYVDFTPQTDVSELFSYYKRTLTALKREHPEIRFAHVTVPLTDRPTDLKSAVKRLLGREVWADAANAKRAEFSRLLREQFREDPIFDLARLEETGPLVGVSSNGSAKDAPSLHPSFTNDGGHLNESGQRAAGMAMVRFLAALSRAEASIAAPAAQR